MQRPHPSSIRQQLGFHHSRYGIGVAKDGTATSLRHLSQQSLDLVLQCLDIGVDFL